MKLIKKSKKENKLKMLAFLTSNCRCKYLTNFGSITGHCYQPVLYEHIGHRSINIFINYSPHLAIHAHK